MKAAHQQVLDEALASEEGQKFQQEYSAKVTELTAAAGFAAPAPDAVDWTNVITVVTKLAPVLVSLLGGWSPAVLVTILPQVISILFPGLDSQLVGLVTQFLTFLIGKLPVPTT